MEFLSLILDPQCPVEWSHPLNRGLVFCHLIAPNPGWRYGRTVRDLVAGGKRPCHGTLSGLAFPSGSSSGWWGSHGRPGGYGSIKFEYWDGTQYVDTGKAFTHSGGATFSWWIWPTSAYNSGQIRGMVGQNWSGSSEFSAQIYSDNNWYVGFNASGADHRVTLAASSTNYVQNEWQHYVFTAISGGVSTLYRNGKSLGTYSTTTFQNPSTTFKWGSQAASSTTTSGLIDDVRLWTRALSAGEVVALYRESRRGYPEALRWLPRKVYYNGDASGGGSTVTRSYSENAGANDTQTFLRLANAFRSVSENAGVNDTQTFLRLANALRTTSDTLAVGSEVFAATLAFGRAYSENAAAQDSAYARVANAFRSISETAGVSDSAYARLANAFRSISESAGVNDTQAFNRLANAFRQYSATAAVGIEVFAVAVSGAAFVTRSFSESLGVSDFAYARIANAFRSVSDNAGIQDTTYTRLTNALRSISESLGLQDVSIARLANAFRSISENVGIQDAAWARLFIQVRSYSESLGIQDSTFGNSVVQALFVAGITRKWYSRDPGRIWEAEDQGRAWKSRDIV